MAGRWRYGRQQKPRRLSRGGGSVGPAWLVRRALPRLRSLLEGGYELDTELQRGRQHSKWVMIVEPSPIRLVAPSLAHVAWLAENLKVRQPQGELGKNRARLNVIDVNSNAVAPRAAAALAAGTVFHESLVTDLLPFDGQVEIILLTYDLRSSLRPWFPRLSLLPDLPDSISAHW